jgi:PKD repeat protein
MCLLPLLAAVHAFGQQQIVVSNGLQSVSPAATTQGMVNLRVTFTLNSRAFPPPPSNVNAQRVFIGANTGSFITCENMQVTATFNIPANEPVGFKDAGVEFSSQQGTLLFTRSKAFQVQNTATEQPAAGFAATPTKGTAPLAVTFSDASTGNITKRLWNFGDSANSTNTSPTHTYSKAGSYTVSLTVEGPGGPNTLARVDYITVTNAPAASPPKAGFRYLPAAPVAGQKVQFADSSSGGPTSWKWSFGDGATSTLQHPTHAYSVAGLFTVSLTAGNAWGSNTTSQNAIVNPPGIEFTMSQTISDEAQRTTLAFSGLAMMTGNLEAQSFFPPGKVADYTGFQYLRDNDPDRMGHNTSFLTRIANNVRYILNDSQFTQLKTLATAQLDQINLYGYKRFPLMKAFRRVLDGGIPSGSAGLNLNVVKKASRELYLLDGQISFDRAILYASLIKSLDSTQKAYLDAMKGKGWNSWPNITNDQIKSKMQGLPQGTAVAVMTYASDLFSWYAGSVDADVYFCPERQRTYFGSFYIKDAPAIGHEGYSIDEQLTATAGAALCDSSKGYVTADQATVMSSLVDKQKNNLHASPTSNIVKVRTEIATLLRSLLTTTGSTDAIKT